MPSTKTAQAQAQQPVSLKNKTVKKQKVQEPVKEVPQEVEVPQETSTTVSASTSVSLEDTLTEISLLDSELKEIQRRLHSLIKQVRHSYKSEVQSLKKMKKVKRNSGNPKSEFKPDKLTPEFIKFLDLPADTVEIPHNELTQSIYSYIRKNKCYYLNEQGEITNRVFMKPDAKLTKLLGPFDFPVKKDGPPGFSIYNFQKYLSRALKSNTSS